MNGKKLSLALILVIGNVFLSQATELPQNDSAFFSQMNQIQVLLRQKSSSLTESKKALSKETIYQDLLHRLSDSAVPRSFVRRALFNPKTKIIPAILGLLHRPAEKMPYEEYRKRFMTKPNIDFGAAFYQKHAKLLSQIQKNYPVDPLILVSLVGVETRWGHVTGNIPVISALYTIAAKIPALSDWARQELAAYMELCYKGNISPQSIKGSYAGAFGYFQFMPSSYNAYAVDFDGDGVKSWKSWPDVLASVAHYLIAHGYAPGDSGPGSAIWNSVYAYNPSDNYVQAVLELREKISDKLSSQ
jgi:membrane-bound lytic murein transglycosylase B